MDVVVSCEMALCVSAREVRCCRELCESRGGEGGKGGGGGSGRCVAVELRRVWAAGQAGSKEGCLSASGFGCRSLLLYASSIFSFRSWVLCVLQWCASVCGLGREPRVLCARVCTDHAHCGCRELCRGCLIKAASWFGQEAKANLGGARSSDC